MNYGVQTLSTLLDWSERFRRNGFRLAVTDENILRSIVSCIGAYGVETVEIGANTANVEIIGSL
jgi:hypothetical protein